MSSHQSPAVAAARPLSPRNRFALDGMNFFLADVRDGLGPYLAIWLLVSRQWDPASIGAVMSVSGIATLIFQIPTGAMIDNVRWKRAAIAGAAIIVALAAVATVSTPSFAVVFGGQVAMGAAAAVFAPALAAVTLGLTGPAAYGARVGRNEAFNHAGNAAAAVMAGLLAHFFSAETIFWLLAGMGLLSAASALTVDGRAIDHAVARGIDAAHRGERPSSLVVLIGNRGLLMLTVAVALFHLGNAAMLPMVGQKLAALRGDDVAFAYMSACIIVAQVVMIGVAALAAQRVDIVGRRPLFLIGFAVLPVRGLLYTITDDPVLLLAIQSLDGIGAGLFGVLFPVMIADLTRGSGHTNLALGASSMIWGGAAAVSHAIAGSFASHMGYDAAFLFLAGASALGGIVFAVAVPETRLPVAPRPIASAPAG